MRSLNGCDGGLPDSVLRDHVQQKGIEREGGDGGGGGGDEGCEDSALFLQVLFDAEMGVACEQNEVVENEKERTPRLPVNETPQHHLELAPVESAQRRVETVVQQGLLLVLLFSQRVEAVEEGGELGDHVGVEATVRESMPTHPLERGQVIGNEGALADHHTTLLEVGERQEQRGENGLQRGREGGDEVIELVLRLTPHTHSHSQLHTVQQLVHLPIRVLHEGAGEILAPPPQQTHEALLLDLRLVHARQQDLHVPERRLQRVLDARRGDALQTRLERGRDGGASRLQQRTQHLCDETPAKRLPSSRSPKRERSESARERSQVWSSG